MAFSIKSFMLAACVVASVNVTASGEYKLPQAHTSIAENEVTASGGLAVTFADEGVPGPRHGNHWHPLPFGRIRPLSLRLFRLHQLCIQELRHHAQPLVAHTVSRGREGEHQQCEPGRPALLLEPRQRTGTRGPCGHGGVSRQRGRHLPLHPCLDKARRGVSELPRRRLLPAQLHRRAPL